MKIRKVHIYDMDGTIVCSLHRYRTIEKNGRQTIDLPHWIENEHRAENDSLLPLASQYKDDLENSSVYTIIATARHLQNPDMRFIETRLGMPNAIVSRKGRDDFRSGADLKIEGLKAIFNSLNLWHTKKFFWEDNFSYLQKVCQAINAKGYFIPSKQGW